MARQAMRAPSEGCLVRVLPPKTIILYNLEKVKQQRLDLV